MNFEQAKNQVKNLSHVQLQNILGCMNISSHGRVASLRGRISRLLQDTTLRVQCVNAIFRVVNKKNGISDKDGHSTSSDASDDESRSPSASPPLEILTRIPMHPDVNFKALPFFDTLAELIKPTSLSKQINILKFHLTPTQTQTIKSGRNPPEYLYQILLRIGLNETTSEQNDCIPPGATVQVNGHSYHLPQASNAATLSIKTHPMSITHFIRLDPTFPNQIQVTTMPHFQRFVVAAYLVKKLSSKYLLNSLRSKAIKIADFTKAMIIQKLTSDENEIALTHLLVKLICPLGKRKIEIPCRATTCEHIQCFDCNTYLQWNERKPTWLCPVCNKAALFENLVIDEYFQKILTSRLPPNCNEVKLTKDGVWHAIGGESDMGTSSSAVQQSEGGNDVELLTVSDSEEECAVVRDLEPEVYDISDSPPLSPIRPPKKRLDPANSNQPNLTKSRDCGAPTVICIPSDSDEYTSTTSDESESDSSSSHIPRLNPASVLVRKRNFICPLRSESSEEEDSSKEKQAKLSKPGDSCGSHAFQYSINRAKSSSTTLVIKKMLADSSTCSDMQTADIMNAGEISPNIDLQDNYIAANDESGEMSGHLIVSEIINDLINDIVVSKHEGAWEETIEDIEEERTDDSVPQNLLDGTESQVCFALLNLSSKCLSKPQNPPISPCKEPPIKNLSSQKRVGNSQCKPKRTFRPSILRRKEECPKTSVISSSSSNSDVSPQSEQHAEEGIPHYAVEVDGRKRFKVIQGRFPQQDLITSRHNTSILNNDSESPIESTSNTSQKCKQVYKIGGKLKRMKRNLGGNAPSISTRSWFVRENLITGVQRPSSLRQLNSNIKKDSLLLNCHSKNQMITSATANDTYLNSSDVDCQSENEFADSESNQSQSSDTEDTPPTQLRGRNLRPRLPQSYKERSQSPTVNLATETKSITNYSNTKINDSALLSDVTTSSGFADKSGAGPTIHKPNILRKQASPRRLDTNSIKRT